MYNRIIKNLLQRENFLSFSFFITFWMFYSKKYLALKNIKHMILKHLELRGEKQYTPKLFVEFFLCEAVANKSWSRDLKAIRCPYYHSFPPLSWILKLAFMNSAGYDLWLLKSECMIFFYRKKKIIFFCWKYFWECVLMQWWQ